MPILDAYEFQEILREVQATTSRHHFMADLEQAIDRMEESEDESDSYFNEDMY